MMFGCMKMMAGSRTMEIIAMNIPVYPYFGKLKNKNHQRENGEYLFQFLHG